MVTRAVKEFSDFPLRVTLLLTAAQAMSHFHRTLLSLLAEPIRLEFGVRDSLIGLLIGPAFSVSYVIAALPLAMAADRSDRFRLLSACVAIWSFLTSLSAFTAGIIGLLLCRIGSAAAMSGVTPTAGSTIANLFPPKRLTSPMSVYSSGVHVGVGLATILGALASRIFDPFALFEVGFLGQMSGWKITFLLAGIPGLVLAVAFGGFRDQFRPRPLASDMDKPASVFKHLLGRPRVFVAVILGLSLLIFVSNAIGAWLPTFFYRKYGWGPGEIGVWFGLLNISAALLGVTLGGPLVGLARRVGRFDPQFLVLMIAAVLALPISILIPLVQSPTSCLALFFIRSMFGVLFIAVGYTLLLRMSPDAFRSRTVAVAGISLNIIGGGLGPLAVALTTDHIFMDPQSLPSSISVVSAIGSVLAIMALAAFRKCEAKAKHSETCR